MTVLKIATPTTHPRRKTGPFTRARAENSTRITAMTPAGLIATPIANGRTSLIALPMSHSSRTANDRRRWQESNPPDGDRPSHSF